MECFCRFVLLKNLLFNDGATDLAGFECTVHSAFRTRRFYSYHVFCSG